MLMQVMSGGCASSMGIAVILGLDMGRAGERLGESLARMAPAALVRAGHRVIAPRELPPNDGGIAAGQALGAWWQLTSVLPG